MSRRIPASSNTNPPIFYAFPSEQILSKKESNGQNKDSKALRDQNSGPKGRRFKSCHLDQNRQILSRDLSISLLDYDILIILHHSPKEFAMTNQDYLSEDEVIKGVSKLLEPEGSDSTQTFNHKSGC